MPEERNQVIGAFLERAGWGGAVREALAGDASFRRYQRLSQKGRTAVLMDAPPSDKAPSEDTRPFVLMARHLLGLGLSAPVIIAEDIASGLLLLEDLGLDTYTQTLDKGGDEEALYARAVDVLIDLHRREQAEVIPPQLPLYDSARLIDESLLLPQWYLPAITGKATEAATTAALKDAFGAVFLTHPPDLTTLVLRDFHVDNLIWLQDRAGVRGCGLLDFQDAVAGDPAYDLMSLLEDARRDIKPELKDAMLERYFNAFPGLDKGRFMTAFASLGASRHAKVIGIFTRLALRDGKPAYLTHIPRVWRLLEQSLRHPTLSPVLAWFDKYIPPPQRNIPSPEAPLPK